MISPALNRLLVHLDAALATGVCPSLEELRVQLDYRSKNTILVMLDKLERQGYIRRLRNRQRAIEILRRPGDGPATIFRGQPLRFIPILPAHGSMPERAAF